MKTIRKRVTLVHLVWDFKRDFLLLYHFLLNLGSDRGKVARLLCSRDDIVTLIT